MSVFQTNLLVKCVKIDNFYGTMTNYNPISSSKFESLNMNRIQASIERKFQLKEKERKKKGFPNFWNCFYVLGF